MTSFLDNTLGKAFINFIFNQSNLFIWKLRRSGFMLYLWSINKFNFVTRDYWQNVLVIRQFSPLSYMFLKFYHLWNHQFYLIAMIYNLLFYFALAFLVFLPLLPMFVIWIWSASPQKGVLFVVSFFSSITPISGVTVFVYWSGTKFASQIQLFDHLRKIVSKQNLSHWLTTWTQVFVLTVYSTSDEHPLFQRDIVHMRLDPVWQQYLLFCVQYLAHWNHHCEFH